MASEQHDEKSMVRYLLGDLPAEEEARIEDRAFADRDYMGALDAAEADLIDAYVRGELSQAERRGFENRFLTSPQRRRKVEFARSLARIADATAAEEGVILKPPSARLSLLGMLRGWNPALQFGLGLAALVAVAGASWFMVENRSIRSQMAALETQQRDLETREEQLRRQLSEEQNRAGTLAEELQKRPTPGAPAFASLVLLPGLSRAETNRAQLALKPSEQLARIEILLEPRDDFPRFTAELRTGRGDEVLARSNLSRRRTAAGYVVAFDVPTSALETADYELTLKGVTSDGRAQDLGFYYFRVNKP